MGRVPEADRSKGPVSTEEQRALAARMAARRRSTLPKGLRLIPRERPCSGAPKPPTQTDAAIPKPASLPIRTASCRRQSRPTVLRPIPRARPLSKILAKPTEGDATAPPVPIKTSAQPVASEDKALPPLTKGVGWPSDGNGYVPATDPELVDGPPRRESYRMLREPKPPGYKYLDKYTKEELVELRKRTLEERTERMVRRFRELEIKYAPIILRTPLKLKKPTVRKRKTRASRKRDSETNGSVRVGKDSNGGHRSL